MVVPDIDISDAEMAQLERRIIMLSKALPAKDLRKVLSRSARPFIRAARTNAPHLSVPKHRYSTPKVSGKIKAPKGMGNIVATYMPGNLSRSIRRIALRRLVRAILIGPKVNKRSSKGVFQGNRVDGYYAHMVEGGTKHAAPKPFIGPAWGSTRSAVLVNVEREIGLMITKKTS